MLEPTGIAPNPAVSYAAFSTAYGPWNGLSMGEEHLSALFPRPDCHAGGRGFEPCPSRRRNRATRMVTTALLHREWAAERRWCPNSAYDDPSESA